jgi:Uncharacterized protein conserved in bacteria (DUF2330)
MILLDRDLGGPSLLLVGALALALAHTPTTHACGGMVFPEHETRVGGMSDQELLVAFTESETVLVASAGYQGVDAADFAFLLPLASNPTDVRDADPALFIVLDEHAAPRVSIYLEEDEGSGGGGCGAQPGGDSRNTFDSAGGGEDNGDGDVMVHQRGQTATYEYVVVGGDTGSAVADWLTDEGYPLPADYAAALDPYVADNAFFFAAKVLPEATSGALSPIELHLPASPPEAFTIPLAIAAHSLAPGEALGLTTYLWADGAILPEGYPAQALVEEELVALSDSESNYAELERAILESDPQGAWIIDKSGITDVEQLANAYGAALDAGRADPATSDSAFVADFFMRLGASEGHLTRVRTELRAEQLRNMPLRRSAGTTAVNHHELTFHEDEAEAEGCAVDRAGRLGGAMLLLVPVLAAIRPRRTRRQGTGR